MSEPESPPFIRIRGRSFVALVLSPEPPTEAWLTALDAQIARSPAFFDARPVVVDLSGLPGTGQAQAAFIDKLLARDIRIIGVEGADPSCAEVEGWGDTWGRPPLAGAGRADRAIEAPDEAARLLPPPPPEPTSRLYDRPIRSGQSIVFEHGDVVVLGSVASGAEVIAGGSVHIYGALRGRAIAGFMGRPEARIFCRRFEAELLAIDGVYKTADDMEAGLRGRPVQAWLDGDAVKLAALD